MPKADDLRKRADNMTRFIKGRRGKPAKEVILKKQKALRDLADNEDWLEGKVTPVKK